MTVTVQSAIDEKHPPAGTRLQALATAAAYGVTLREMADHAGVPRQTLFRALSENQWPVRAGADTAEMKRAITELLAARGVEPYLLATLFHAHVSNSRRWRPESVQAVDGYGRPVDENGKRIHPAQDQETDVLLPKQTLSPEARKAFQLFMNPFDGEVMTEEQMFCTGEIAYVREACLQVAVGGRFVALISESGGGKTTILGDLEARIQRDRRPVIVIKPWVLGMEDNDTKGKTLKAADILASIITTLDQLAVVPQTLQARSNRARELLAKSCEAGFMHMLVIEEAHSLPDPTLKHLKRLHEMRLGRRPLLGILLLAQTELALKLDPKRASLREVTQRCEIVQLLPLDNDLQAYLEHRAQQASRPLSAFIDASGIEEIRRRLTVERPGPGGQRRATSLLYPLAVNNLVTAALNVAAELGVPVVNRDVVRAI